MMAFTGTSGGSLDCPTVEKHAVPRWLVWASLSYLTLPVLLFLSGWLQPLWACLGTISAFAMVATLGYGHKVCRMPSGWRWWHGALLVVTIALVVSTQGAGGFGIQNWDWAKHLAILRDLMDHPWPVMYHTTKDTVSLTYYVAYYLPAALVGHAFGWTAANTTLWLWTIAGCALACFWLVALSGARWWIVLLVLLLFSGGDLIGAMVSPGALNARPWQGNFDMEWWSKRWVFPANLTLIAYVPHQAIAGWLLTALLIHGLHKDAEAYHAAGLMVLSMLWSPFITIGLALVYAGWLVWHRNLWRAWLAAQCTWRNGPTLFLGLILVLYFASKFTPYELPSEFYPSRKITAKGDFYFALSHGSRDEFAVLYLLTLLLEFGLLAFLLFKTLPDRHRTDVALLASASACLLLLPWVHYGHFNDLVMRVCIPALFVLQVLVLHVLSAPRAAIKSPASAWARPALIGLLIIGALNPVNMLRVTGQRLAQRQWHLYYLSDYKLHPDLFQQQLDGKKQFYLIGQYMGASDSFFFRHLARSAPPWSGTAIGKKSKPAP
ncbi:hypothetical protein DES53_10579 [Roseimicrobium gellanilyticum]|uniref:Uncharacterized protein n=1 Tax=Roseimicrobium gellanilyticum TaxID=748857 RepID=A0A366HL70_9BACT|nr:hypothetical protein [Roseimicrobium gellanilyticum]RBP43680.1 hypothetical protein DES53_10579 [Roseimicrobium gellanilyticum]